MYVFGITRFFLFFRILKRIFHTYRFIRKRERKKKEFRDYFCSIDKITMIQFFLFPYDKFVWRVEIDRNKYFEGFMVEIYHHLFSKLVVKRSRSWEGFGEIDTTRAPNTLKVGTASSSWTWTWTSTTSFETSRCCCVHAVDSRVLPFPTFRKIFRISKNTQMNANIAINEGITREGGEDLSSQHSL